MAKVDNQSIPSEDRILYKRALQISTTIFGNTYVRTRYPWRLPQMQAGKADEKAGQKIQRARFRYVLNKYALHSPAGKARWAAANPEYNSFLFGYNFYMLEGLQGGGPDKFPQMIKSIQVIKDTMSKTGNTGFVIAAVDPAKTVILINGNSFVSDKIQRGNSSVADGATVNIALSPSVDPAISEVTLNGAIGRSEVDAGSGEGEWGAPYVSALIAAQLTVTLRSITSTVREPSLKVISFPLPE